MIGILVVCRRQRGGGRDEGRPREGKGSKVWTRSRVSVLCGVCSPTWLVLVLNSSDYLLLLLSPMLEGA